VYLTWLTRNPSTTGLRPIRGSHTRCGCRRTSGWWSRDALVELDQRLPSPVRGGSCRSRAGSGGRGRGRSSNLLLQGLRQVQLVKDQVGDLLDAGPRRPVPTWYVLADDSPIEKWASMGADVVGRVDSTRGGCAWSGRPAAAVPSQRVRRETGASTFLRETGASRSLLAQLVMVIGRWYVSWYGAAPRGRRLALAGVVRGCAAA